MNTEQETLSTEVEVKEFALAKDIVRLTVHLTLNKEVYEYLDKCFQLVGNTWPKFIQYEIDDSIKRMSDSGLSGYDWLWQEIEDKLNELIPKDEGE